MNLILHYSFCLLLPTTVLVHLIVSPYTKVEESFNIQATHDVLAYGVPLDNVTQHLTATYDHVTFRGSVPRTFVGALLLAGLSRPLTSWVASPLQLQILVRAILGLGNAAALLSFYGAVNQAFGKTAGYWYILLQASQFHLMYYASRTLPNMFAFGLTTLALRSLVMSNFGRRERREKRARLALYLFTIAGIVFRSEVALLLAAVTTSLVLVQRVSITRVVVPAGVTAMTIGLLLTVSIDSFFWQKFPLWPEWAAFRYNTIEGKSAEWGTSPWHFYFSNSIPRLLMNPMTLLVCIPISLSVKATRRFSYDILMPLLGFVAVYSVLPHKEWRFIIYIIPALTAVASAGASWIWIRRSKSISHQLLACVLVVSVVASFAISAGLLAISSLNYPGGMALDRLHEIADGTQPQIRVHLDNLSCQTGVTRFLQIPSPPSPLASKTGTIWIYDKTEDAEQLLTPTFWQASDYVLAEHPEKVIGKWEIVEEVNAFAGLGVVDAQSADEHYSERDQISPNTTKEAELTFRLYGLWQLFSTWMKRHVTKGRWVVIKMEPKMRIMKRQSQHGTQVV